MEITQEQKLYQQVVQKAWEDAEFKAELVANPVAAIEKFTGKKMNIPEGKTLIVRDQTEQSTVYINIPAKPETDVELNEDELEKVAGGCQHGLNSGNPNPITIGYPTPKLPGFEEFDS